jgi:hypothetical protein
MYSQSRYQEEDIDRLQAEAEKIYLNKDGKYNGREERGREERGREERGREERIRRFGDDRRRNSEYDDRRRSSERRSSSEYDDRRSSYGHDDDRDRDVHVPVTHVPVTHVHVPVTHVPVPVHVTHAHVPTPHGHVPVATNIKKYRAATYDKQHDKVFAKQMQNFAVPQEFNTFTNDLLKEPEISRLCLLEAIADYNKTGGPALLDTFQKAAEHCRKYRALTYDIHDQTYAKQMQFYDLPPEFSEFTDGLLKETHINRFDLLEAIENYNAKGLPQLPCVFQEVAFNCRPYQTCVIC